jgi:glycosyltransferase involved in cell wall biosynthesis
VVYLGSVSAAERPAVLGSAGALLHPVHFDEPFGLSVVEAMACGTPVIAYRRGSMPEVVDQGVTGLLVHPLDGVSRAVRSVEPALALDRGAVRDRARQRFGLDPMIDSYLGLYGSVLATASSPRLTPPTRALRREIRR